MSQHRNVLSFPPRSQTTGSNNSMSKCIDTSSIIQFEAFSGLALCGEMTLKSYFVVWHELLRTRRDRYSSADTQTLYHTTLLSFPSHLEMTSLTLLTCISIVRIINYLPDNIIPTSFNPAGSLTSLPRKMPVLISMFTESELIIWRPILFRMIQH